MLLALSVAVVAVALGVLLGLAPAASRRLLGPLRTLALTAVLAVVGLHLLPEALEGLQAVGLVVFGVGLALPRWLGWITELRGDSNSNAGLGLELGFWGLVIHHVGDGLALGAYSRVNPETSRAPLDVLIALVLHTVPLVAVVVAGYARVRGARAATRRGLQLALASAAGVVLTFWVPAAVIAGAQAWIAAAVSGLLLHGLTHELGHDLPEDALGRALDLAMVVAGVALGWLGTLLEAHDVEAASAMSRVFSLAVQRAAAPVLLGLVLASLLALFRERRSSAALAPGLAQVFGAEAFLLTVAHFGWLFAVARDASAGVGALIAPDVREAPMSITASTPGHARPWVRFVRHLDARIDAVFAWALTGALVAAVIQMSLPLASLESRPIVAVFAALAFALSVPLHAVAAPQIAFALSQKGLSASAAFALCVLSAFGARPFGARPWLLIALTGLIALALGPWLPRAALVFEAGPSRVAALVLLALALRRAYRLGFRALFLPLVAPNHPGHHGHDHGLAVDPSP